MKVCVACGKTTDQFYVRRGGRTDKTCKACRVRSAGEWQKANVVAHKRCQVKWREAMRDEILERYGRICACCGEHRKNFLAIDHINGGGSAHRKAIGGGGPRLRSWLKQNGFPAGFRTLCHNCNMSIGSFGSCPHDDEKRMVLVV